MPLPMRDDESLWEALTGALKDVREGVAITDMVGNVLWVNPAFCDLAGLSARETLAEAPGLRPYGQHTGSSCASFWRTVLAGRSWTGIVTNRRRGGEAFAETVTVTPLKDDATGARWLVAIHAPHPAGPAEGEGLAALDRALAAWRRETAGAIHSQPDRATAG